jgi:hypothetical protein
MGKEWSEMKRYFGLVLVSGVLSGSMHLSADEAISITVRPSVATARGTAQLKVLIAPNEKNRQLIWEADGPNYYRSSAIELEGASAPRSYFFTVKDLAEGSLEVRATIRRNDDSRAMDRRRIVVVP